MSSADCSVLTLFVGSRSETDVIREEFIQEVDAQQALEAQRLLALLQVSTSYHINSSFFFFSGVPLLFRFIMMPEETHVETAF